MELAHSEAQEAELRSLREEVESLRARLAATAEANVHAAELVLELENTQDLLHKRSEDAEAARRAKSASIANLSHEFRTPLNAVIGFCDLLLADADRFSETDLDYPTPFFAAENGFCNWSKGFSISRKPNRRIWNLKCLVSTCFNSFACRSRFFVRRLVRKDFPLSSISIRLSSWQIPTPFGKSSSI